MTAAKINQKNLRAKCKAKQLTISELARRIGKSRQAVYFSVENPGRFGITYRLILEELAA